MVLRPPPPPSERVSRVEDSSPADTWTMGRIKVHGIGESRITVKFPVIYVVKPLPLLNGIELEIGDSTYPEALPTASMIVTKWHKNIRPTGDHYTGVDLVIATTGRVNQDIYVTYAFVGTALTNHGGT